MFDRLLTPIFEAGANHAGSWAAALALVGALALALLLRGWWKRPLGLAAVFAVAVGVFAWTVGTHLPLAPAAALVAPTLAVAMLAAAAMVSGTNPVYSSLHFALAVVALAVALASAGAWFLAASVVIVYAGAIIVTLLFVLMLANQSGMAAYDQNHRRLPVALGAAAVLLGTLFTVVSAAALALPTGAADAGPPTVGRIGVSLWSRHLLTVELAGAALLAATVGAVAISLQKVGDE